MLIEAEAIPYEPSHLRGERLLVLAPHPDDEVIGCGGLLALHLRENRPTRVLVVTDGAEGGDAAVRQEESRRGLALLGSPELYFLGYRDRALDLEVAPPLREHLREFAPDLILIPGPGEIHPDHVALTRIFCELIQRDETLFGDLATARVAFYEVSQPLRPNAIVDITGVATAKEEAIRAHASQLEQHDYPAYARGLNTYRAMTLPAGALLAEAYHVVRLPELRTTPFSRLRQMTGAPPLIEISGEIAPVSVVIRTRNRLALLEQAVESVRATEYPCEIVVVNDGGPSPNEMLAARRLAPGQRLALVDEPDSRGRSEAGNIGVRTATGAFVAFLDDDDLFYPEHLGTLTAASRSSHVAWYSDALSAFLRPGESGAYETHARLRLFSRDYDPALLLIDNYIPLPTLLLRRDSFLQAGGFDAEFDLFEDWDLLLRLSAGGSFLHVPRLTCEIRHFEGGTSAVLAAPEGSDRFRQAKLQIWNKHRDKLDDDLIAAVFETQKRRTQELYSSLIETRGQTDAARGAAQAAVRETAEKQEALGRYMIRAAEVEGAYSALQMQAAAATRELAERIEALTRENESLRSSERGMSEELRRALGEIARLNSLLEMIFRSKTWKLHTLVERFRGRG